jgi:hypothetical protein
LISVADLDLDPDPAGTSSLATKITVKITLFVVVVDNYCGYITYECQIIQFLKRLFRQQQKKENVGNGTN